MSKDLYEVYVVSTEDTILYVGQGKLGRHQHCDSGLSHVYGLNRLHFGKVKLKVEVVETFKTKVESEKMEFELIKKFNPKFNLKNNGDSSMWSLNNKYYLDHLCNIKTEQPHEEYDECSWDDTGFDYLGVSQPLVFKAYSNYYMVDTEANNFDINTKKLLKHKDLKLYTRSEVETFCVQIFMCGGLDGSWRTKKATKRDLECLLKDCLYRIEYS